MNGSRHVSERGDGQATNAKTLACMYTVAHEHDQSRPSPSGASKLLFTTSTFPLALFGKESFHQ